MNTTLLTMTTIMIMITMVSIPTLLYGQLKNQAAQSQKVTDAATSISPTEETTQSILTSTSEQTNLFHIKCTPTWVWATAKLLHQKKNHQGGMHLFISSRVCLLTLPMVQKKLITRPFFRMCSLRISLPSMQSLNKTQVSPHTGLTTYTL